MDSLEEEISDDVPRLESGVLKSYFTMIAPWFENLSILKVLDLSRTNIQSLPPSISMLSELVTLTLQECSMLMVIPPEIGSLKNLTTFDLEGTEIMYLPNEMGNLEELQCLRVSFCAYADEYKDRNGIENIIPRTIMSKFGKLEELSICVDPDAKWWEVEVKEAILENLHFLPCLQTLKLYLPTAKELQYFLQYFLILENSIYSTLRDFRLKIGHCEQLPSYLKTKLVDSFEKLEKCLKYENGEGSTDDVKELVRHAKALFVCRHLTIEKLSIFDTSRLKYCLLAECNNMRNIVVVDDLYGGKIITHNNDVRNAFEFLEYLAVHSMKNLRSIWKGPIARESLTSLKVLALHTCPNLTTVFTEGMLASLQNLTVVIVEDCPKITSLIARGSIRGHFKPFLPRLRKILLLDLPELVSLSNGVNIAPRLDTLLVFNCMKLSYLSRYELSTTVREIKGETEWWDVLKNRDEYLGVFVPLKRDGDLMTQLAEDTDSLWEFGKLHISGYTFFPLDSRPSSAQFSLHVTKKDLYWGMFIKFLVYQKLPLHYSKLNSVHVIEFLKYISKFGDIRVHVQSCVIYGRPNPAVTCFCPLGVAWYTLEVIVTRLLASFRKYMRQHNRQLSKAPMEEVAESSDSESTSDSSDSEFDPEDFSVLPLKRKNVESFPSKDIHSYLNEVKKSQENALGIISKTHSFPALTDEEESDFGSRQEKSFPMEVYNDPVLRDSDSDQDWLEKSFHSIKLVEFRNILQSAIGLRQHSFSVNLVSTTFIETSTQDSSSNKAVQEEEYVTSNTMSPEALSQLRNIAVRASSNGYILPLVEIYIAERKTTVQSRFRFFYEKWSTCDVKKLEWGVLESLIEVWINSVKTSFDYLFASEKQSCVEIFRGLGADIEDICFEVVAQEYRIQVFNIIYTLSFINPPPDKIFLILDLYQTLDYFLNERLSFAKTRDPFQATVHTQLLTELADKISSNLSVFEMVLSYHESSVIFVGPVDPLPGYVMSYLCQLCAHKHTLRKLSLPDLSSIDENDPILYSEELKGQSELSRHVIWIIMMVVSNLDGKAKLCEDGSAGHFFAMKNISYIVNKIEGHQDLKEVIGYDYYGKLIQKLDHAKFNYVRLELVRIIQMRDYGAE